MIVASDETEAKDKLGDDSFTFVKVITRGRSPKEGFVADKKAPAKEPRAYLRPNQRPQSVRPRKTAPRWERGMTAERAKKESDKVATQRSGRKPMDKDAYL